MDRERRKKNLIIHNLPEPTVGDTDEQRTTGDLQAISGLLDSEFGVSRNQVSKPVRLGAKKSNKPRLLKIEISDVNVKRNILKQATKLRSSSTYGNIYISPDLTRKEREHSKALREELLRRKAAGEKDIFIKFGKIVTRSTQAPDGARTTN